MSKTDRLVTAAIAAAMLLAEAACSNDPSAGYVTCKTIDPKTGMVRVRKFPADYECPPVASNTVARGATHVSPGWYYIGASHYYGWLPRGARSASAAEADKLQADATATAVRANAENEQQRAQARANFGESGAHGSGG